MPRAMCCNGFCGGWRGHRLDKYFNGSISDSETNTILNIAKTYDSGIASEGRTGPLRVPTLQSLGLGNAVLYQLEIQPQTFNLEKGAAYAVAAPVSMERYYNRSLGVGVPLDRDWHYFPDTDKAFDTELVNLICDLGSHDGILGNCHASGTEILNELGEEHCQSGKPICYTSADSVFQIAAHEEYFGLSRLYDLCHLLAPYLHKMNVGRVIARPFIGDNKSGWSRTINRRDFAMAPPKKY